ncbi:MAG TPA: response regulator [Terriglobia bacterium]|nr:response regulator [Terriglobia bacterium]
MKETIRALLVLARHDSCEALRLGLEAQLIEICTAKNCMEAALTLCSHCPPHLVFTDIELSDGNWTDVLSLAACASAPVNVIVVSPHVDVALYIRAMEGGAFDFIVCPPGTLELLHVVRVAAGNVFKRRHEASAVVPTSSPAVASLAEKR